MSYSSMSSKLRGYADNTDRKGKAGWWCIRPQLVSLELRLNVPQKGGKILLFRDPRSLRGLCVRRKIRGMLFYICICTREFH